MPVGLQRGLEELGTPLYLKPHLPLPLPVCAHPDLLCFYDREKGELYTFLDYYSENRGLFDALPVKTIALDLKAGSYPADLFFDQLLCKGTLIGRAPYIPLPLAQGKRVLSVKQGYAKCATLLFGDCAVTADSGIKKALRELGVKVLEIENEGIALPGYDKGFIGGASAVIGKRVCFFGNPLSHPQGEDIVSFVKSAGYEPHALFDGVLTDYGGLIVIHENAENVNALLG